MTIAPYTSLCRRRKQVISHDKTHYKVRQKSENLFGRSTLGTQVRRGKIGLCNWMYDEDSEVRESCEQCVDGSFIGVHQHGANAENGEAERAKIPLVQTTFDPSIWGARKAVCRRGITLPQTGAACRSRPNGPPGKRMTAGRHTTCRTPSAPARAYWLMSPTT